MNASSQKQRLPTTKRRVAERAQNRRPCSAAAAEARAIPVSRPARDIAAGLGPRAVLKRANLKEKSVEERRHWMEEARLDAILGQKESTLKSLRSGVSCYTAFAGAHVVRSHLGTAPCCLRCQAPSIQRGDATFHRGWTRSCAGAHSFAHTARGEII